MSHVSVKKIIKSLIIVVVSLMYIRYNLITYSLFYSQFLPCVDGEQPALIMLADNYQSIWHPYCDEVVSKGPFSETSLSSTHFTSRKDDSLDISIDDDGDGRTYIYRIKAPTGLKPKHMTYYFDEHFNLIKAHDDDANADIDPVQVNKQHIINEITRLVMPVIEDQHPPIINLQAIFNLVHWHRFN